jgi:hypothetical protein
MYKNIQLKKPFKIKNNQSHITFHLGKVGKESFKMTYFMA